MTQLDAQIRVAAQDGLRVAVIPFRFADRLTLTIAVKATFDISHNGPARLVLADPISHEDVHTSPPTHFLSRATDLALRKWNCDVILVGEPVGDGAKGTSFGVYGDGKTLIEKQVPVTGIRPLGAVCPEKTPRGWLLESCDMAALRAPVPVVPQDFPWTYFQAAPEDQQIPHLRGNEWISLDGFAGPTPAAANVRAQLPSLHPRVWLIGLPAWQLPVSVAMDTLVIDPFQRRASIVFRGLTTSSVPLERLSELGVVAALGVGTEPPAPLQVEMVLRGAIGVPLSVPFPRTEAAAPSIRGAATLAPMTMAPMTMVGSLIAPEPAAPFPIARPKADTGSFSKPAPWNEPSAVVIPAVAAAGQTTDLDSAMASLSGSMAVEETADLSSLMDQISGASVSATPFHASPAPVQLAPIQLAPIQLGPIQLGPIQQMAPVQQRASFQQVASFQPVSPAWAPSPQGVSAPPGAVHAAPPVAEAEAHDEMVEILSRREPTPPSQLSLAAAALREDGVPESEVQERIARLAIELRRI